MFTFHAKKISILGNCWALCWPKKGFYNSEWPNNRIHTLSNARN